MANLEYLISSKGVPLTGKEAQLFDYLLGYSDDLKIIFTRKT